jgi:hypothetical protein
MTEYERWNLILQATGILVTLILATIAIWGEKIRQLWIKPKLELHLDSPSLTSTADGKKVWCYLIKVLNHRNSSPAKNVRVLLTSIFKKRPDGCWAEQRFSGPIQVTWRWPNWTPLYATIGPQEHCTFGNLREGSKSFRLQSYWCPNNLIPEIAENDPTRLKFKAVSDNAESNILTIELAWDGQWIEGSAEMCDHIIVKEINP